MSTYTATVRWSRNGAEGFTKGQYSRAHEWAFDGGAVVPASPAPGIVQPPYSDPAGVDPEEAFVAALSSCHMLFFLDFARRDGLVVDSYVDEVIAKRAAAGRGEYDDSEDRARMAPRQAKAREKTRAAKAAKRDQAVA